MMLNLPWMLRIQPQSIQQHLHLLLIHLLNLRENYDQVLFFANQLTLQQLLMLLVKLLVKSPLSHLKVESKQWRVYIKINVTISDNLSIELEQPKVKLRHYKNKIVQCKNSSED